MGCLQERVEQGVEEHTARDDGNGCEWTGGLVFSCHDTVGDQSGVDEMHRSRGAHSFDDETDRADEREIWCCHKINDIFYTCKAQRTDHSIKENI